MIKPKFIAMKKIILPLIIAGIVVFAACSQKSTPTKTEDKTEAKSNAIPHVTYTANVQTLIMAKCAPCHIPSRGGNKASFENYTGAQKYAADMVARIELTPGTRGFMPMRGAKLSDDEIAVFKNWVKDGMLEK